MNGPVAVPADIDGAPHLLTVESLFEPFVAVQSAGYQVMLGRPAFGHTLAKLAAIDFGV